MNQMIVMDKDLIKSIMDSDYQIPEDYSIEELTPQLLQNLGSTDSDIREGTLEILYSWIVAGHYSPEKMREMGEKFVENLHHGLGLQNDDSVFLRAFSVLELGGIVDYDESCANNLTEGKDPFLSREIIMDWYSHVKDYMLQERDIRGFVTHKGWAHSVAHASDMMRNFARSRFFGKKELMDLLQTLTQRVNMPSDSVFLHKEEIRLSVAAYTVLLRKDLSWEDIKKWLHSLIEPFKDKKWIEFVQNPEKNIAFVNTHLFLRSFYFMVKFKISQTGSRSIPFYKNNELGEKEQILHELEFLFKSLEGGIFYAQ